MQSREPYTEQKGVGEEGPQESGHLALTQLYCSLARRRKQAIQTCLEAVTGHTSPSREGRAALG